MNYKEGSMNRGNQYPVRVHYEYEQEENVKVKYAHGVWGGITKQGEIELNFYLEHDKVFSRQNAQQNTTMQPMDSSLPVHYVTRSIHSRVLLNYHTARSILEWLEDKVTALELPEDDADSTQEYDITTMEQ